NYMTASGKKIDGIGVEPDIALSGSESTWEQQALDLLRKKALTSGIRFVRSEKKPDPKNSIIKNNTAIKNVIEKPTSKVKL
ncbi:S41 family peptidase, partial [Psychrobacter sp. 16-Bac2893]